MSGFEFVTIWFTGKPITIITTIFFKPTFCLTITLHSKVDPVSKEYHCFRYSSYSCQSLEPQYTLENYIQLNLGPDHLALGDQGQVNQNQFFGAPKKLNNRQPPFEIETDFVEYRKNKKYTGEGRKMKAYK